jgi:hypothetical protein
MRTVSIYTKSLKEAKKQAPWAAKIIKVDGGYIAFESMDDYKTFVSQK